MKSSRIKVILTLVIAAVTIALLAIAVQQFNIFSPDAAGSTPDLITISNVTDSTATISWRTRGSDILTNLQWGNSSVLGNVGTDFRDARDKTTKSRNTHFVQLTKLEANTTYYYRIVSADITYPTSDQAPLTFKTLDSKTATQPAAITLYGDTAPQNADTIITAYVLGQQGYTSIIPLSTVLNSDGTWLINIADARKADGSYSTPTKSTPVAILGIASDGTGVVDSFTAAESPVTLTLATQLTQATIDQLLLDGTITHSQTPSATPTATPTPTSSSRQDMPLRRIGTTATPTPSTGTISALSKEQLLTSFQTPSISNITDESLSIMFLTATPVISSLNWGTATNALTSNRLDDLDNTKATSRYIHHYTLIGLNSHSQYYFRATTESAIRTFTSPIKIAATTGQPIITGTLENAVGECLVRTQLKRSSLYSSTITTIPNATHTWAINVMPVRTISLDTYMMPIATDTVLSSAFCIKEDGSVLYQASSTTLQNAVTSGITLSLSTLQ